MNTGPWTVVGGHYRNWHHNLNEDMPPQSGLDLYSFSKGLGHEISRVFTMNHVSRHSTAAVWVAFSSSGLHSSQDGSDIVVGRTMPSPRTASGGRSGGRGAVGRTIVAGSWVAFFQEAKQ